MNRTPMSIVRRMAFIAVFMSHVVDEKPCPAAVVITMYEDALGVRADLSGSLYYRTSNPGSGYAGLIYTSNQGGLNSLRADLAFLAVGFDQTTTGTLRNLTLATGSISGPRNYGTGNGTDNIASYGGGLNDFVMGPRYGYFRVPSSYTSGAMSGYSRWSGKTLSSLGVTPGTYVWSWGSGGWGGDSVTLTVQTPTAVPEPSSLVLCVVAAASLGLRVRKRIQAAA